MWLKSFGITILAIGLLLPGLAPRDGQPGLYCHKWHRYGHHQTWLVRSCVSIPYSIAPSPWGG